jgi:hypothetical protein
MFIPADASFDSRVCVQMEWFRVAQRAVQLYDVNHARKAGHAYQQHQMNLEDWRINMESVAVLQPIADWTQLMQGTKYPTLPLVLPTVYGLIDGMAPETALTCSFQGAPSYDLEPSEMHKGVLEARTDMHTDWVSRWITNLPPETKRTYAIATLLHPCFKSYDFIDEYAFITSADKAWALRELRTEWATVWKTKPEAAAGPSSANAPVADAPADAPANAAGSADPPVDENGFPLSPMPAPAPAPAPAPVPAVQEPPQKKRKVSLGSLLGKVKKEKEQEKTPEMDEPDFDDPILDWWKVKALKWPALGKMVKQYFAAPASSAGVERVFSAAGKMHGDLQKSAKDSTLEHSLFAAFNTD